MVWYGWVELQRDGGLSPDDFRSDRFLSIRNCSKLGGFGVD